MKPAPFAYARPSTLEGALSLLADDEDAKVIGGGQSLVPMLNFRLARPSTLVDVRHLAELGTIARQNGSVAIGAAVTQREVEHSALVAEAVPLLKNALAHVGHVQTRSRGTIGGSLAHADPAAELPAVALALDATLVATSARRTREIPASEFFFGPYMTALEPDEVLVEIRFPVANGARASFHEVSRRAGDFAIVGIAAQVVFKGSTVVAAHLAGTGVEFAPVRFVDAEAALVGAEVDEATIVEAGDRAAAAVDPREDANATPEHRRELVAALVRRAIRGVTG